MMNDRRLEQSDSDHQSLVLKSFGSQESIGRTANHKFIAHRSQIRPIEHSFEPSNAVHRNGAS